MASCTQLSRWSHLDPAEVRHLWSNGSLPSNSTSTINRILSFTPLRCFRTHAIFEPEVPHRYRPCSTSRTLIGCPLFPTLSPPCLPWPGWQLSLRPRTLWLNWRSFGTYLPRKPVRWLTGKTPSSLTLYQVTSDARFILVIQWPLPWATSNYTYNDQIMNNYLSDCIITMPIS